MKPPPRTGSKLANACLRWAYRAIKENTISMPAVGWTQTPDGLLPPFGGNASAIFRHPFKVTRASVDGDNGVYIQYGIAESIVPTISGGADPLTTTDSDNFLATWSDSGTSDVGRIVIDFTVSNDDEWNMNVTAATMRWYANSGAVPADETGGTSRHIYKVIGYDSPTGGPVNIYFTNLGLIREGQIDANCFLYGL